MISVQPYTIHSINARGLTLEERGRLGRIHRDIAAEYLAGAYLAQPTDYAERWCGLPAFISSWDWVAAPTTESWNWVAHANAICRNSDSDLSVWIEIGVRQDHRRRGIGREMLRLIAAEAVRAGRQLITAQTRSIPVSGDAFMERFGAKIVQRCLTQQLDLTQISSGIISKWVRNVSESNSSLRFGLWCGAYPAEEMWQIPDLLQTIHDAPHDELVTVDLGWSESEIRQREQALQDSGIERWTGFLRDTSSGRLVAYSEIYVTERSTALADQGDTAVRAEWRGQGLGKWVKAATIESFSRARPQTRYLTTSNAVTNSAILKINEQLGFRRLNTMTTWQLSVSKALASLAR